MHGRPRNAPPAVDESKISRLRDLQAQLLHHHHNRIYTKEALEACSKLLAINPEIYTAWNYRKSALQHKIRDANEPGAVKSLVDEELRVVESALEQNPKAYGAWYHRKWLLKQEFSPTDFDHEFQLLKKLHKMDARNFHGWIYRRFLASLSKVPEEKELKYTSDMIDINFSNYSAWHNRCVLLSNILKQRDKGLVSREKILSAEYELVHDALFTEASDQSGWFYHLWLIDQTISSEDLLLTSSWPVHQSHIQLYINRKTDRKKFILFKASKYHYLLHRETIPIILYFNQAIKGFNASTVILGPSGKDVKVRWRPLSVTSSGTCHCWVTDLEIPDSRTNDLETYSVDIILDDDSIGIVSSKGTLSSSLHLFFTLELNHTDSENAEGDYTEQIFNWHDDILTSLGCHKISFDRLRIVEEDVTAVSKWQMETLSNEIMLFKDSPDENCKFVKLTLARLLNAYNKLALTSDRRRFTQKEVHYTEEILKLFDELIELDPSHANYYADQRSLILVDQKTSGEADSAFSTHLFGSALRLTDLSLTRIGFVERLLWVQILDLSKNKLRSISGLEALQLLICLNISKNQISSFTALGPIRLLPNLNVLDVSFNKIESHGVDTNRYLGLPPPAKTLAMTPEFQMEGIEIAGNWETILIFKNMNLTQLRVEGNPIAGDVFKILIKKLIPSLVWFDSERA